MIFGAITNSWQRQLPEQNLATLIGEAWRRGARHIELRATCLGDCETGAGDAWRPVLPNLQALAQQFPDVSFDLAVPFPCLTTIIDPRGEQFQSTLTAAKYLNPVLPHLRTVDGHAFDTPWEGRHDIPDVALGIVDLTREAARQGVIFSIENVSQPLRSMALLIEAAQTYLAAEERLYLGLCVDPTNQLRVYPDSDPLSELAAIPLDMLKMVHIKQTRDYKPYPTVDTGDLDCLKMLEVLRTMQYDGPVVLEIPPHAHALENLTASLAFLHVDVA